MTATAERAAVRWRVRRWWYRRMAWKNDSGLWCDMHPWLAWMLDQWYEHSWPVRRVWDDLRQSAHNHQTELALRKVYYCGPKEEIKYWKDGRSAYQVYREAGSSPREAFLEGASRKLWPEPPPLPKTCVIKGPNGYQSDPIAEKTARSLLEGKEGFWIEKLKEEVNQ